MSTRYAVQALTGGGDSFDTLEEARNHASELLGENDSLDIEIVDDAGQHHLTYVQLTFVNEVSQQPHLSINLQLHIFPDTSDERITSVVRHMRQLAVPGRI